VDIFIVLYLFFVGMDPKACGTKFNFVARTMTKRIQSVDLNSRMLCFVFSVPNHVKVRFQNDKADTVVVSFSSLEGQALRYAVKCYTPTMASCWDEEVPFDQKSLSVSPLLPHTNYTFVVTTIAGGTGVLEKSVEESYSVRTVEAGELFFLFVYLCLRVFL
jgi:hypothetical protein